jgi:hypothetical protein
MRKWEKKSETRNMVRWNIPVVVLYKVCANFLVWLCGRVCQWLAADQWFSPGTTVSSTPIMIATI